MTLYQNTQSLVKQLKATKNGKSSQNIKLTNFITVILIFSSHMAIFHTLIIDMSIKKIWHFSAIRTTKSGEKRQISTKMTGNNEGTQTRLMPVFMPVFRQ